MKVNGVLNFSKSGNGIGQPNIEIYSTSALTLFPPPVYIRILYMIHILYGVYICLSLSPPPLFSLFLPPHFLLPNQNAFSQPSLCFLG